MFSIAKIWYFAESLISITGIAILGTYGTFPASKECINKDDVFRVSILDGPKMKAEATKHILNDGDYVL